MWLHYVVHVRSCTSVVHSLCTYVVVYESTKVPSKVHSVPSKVSDIFYGSAFVPSKVLRSIRTSQYTSVHVHDYTYVYYVYLRKYNHTYCSAKLLGFSNLPSYTHSPKPFFFRMCFISYGSTKVLSMKVLIISYFRREVHSPTCVHKNKNRIVYSYLRLHVRTCTRTSTVHVYTTLFLSIYFCTLCSSTVYFRKYERRSNKVRRIISGSTFEVPLHTT